MRRRPARPALVAAVGVLALAAAGCTTSTAQPAPPGSGTAAAKSTASTPSATPTPQQKPLVVGAVFDHTTLDPTRQFDRTGAMLTHALYETLTTLDPDDPTKVVPGMAEYTISPEGKWLTMRLRKDLVFSDGTPVTTDDVVFTIERAKGLGGPTAAMLGTVGATKVDDRTFTLTSPGSNFALPAILANPALGILNAAAVRSHGGTIGPGDEASSYLSQHSAGSGPYVIESVRGTSEVRLAANPMWRGTAPAFTSVVVRNLAPAQQLAAVRTGAADLVLDLSPGQADGATARPPASAVTVTSMRSSTLTYLALDQKASVNAWTANPRFAEAIRRGIDRDALAKAVPGAASAPGLIPAGIVGALDDLPPAAVASGSGPSGTGTTGASGTTGTSGSGGSSGTPVPTATSSATAPTGAVASPTTPSDGTTTGADGRPTPVVTLPLVPARDLAAARAALRSSGYKGQPVSLTYAADVPVQGLPTGTIAAAVAKQLGEVGITVRLDPQPAQKALAAYRAGRTGLSLWAWSPDYPDPENYLAFGPGGLVGSRTGFVPGLDPLVDSLTEKARDSIGDDREIAYAAWQQAMNERGPFVPLLQPSTRFASGDRVAAVPGNPVWTIDLSPIR